MVKKSALPETGEAVCPACGAGIKTPAISRRRRIQCPKCREVVFLESSHGPEAEPAPAPPPPAPPSSLAETPNRVALLEARVEALEATLRDALAAARTTPAGAPQRKLVWLTSP